MDNSNAVKAKELRDLQKSIKEINTERAKREGQRDNLIKQLTEEMTAYLEKNDITVKLNSLDEAYAFAKKEYARVSEQQKQEIELKQRLVALYEQKNIQGMRELLELEDSEDDFVVSHEGSKEEEVEDKPTKPAKPAKSTKKAKKPEPKVEEVDDVLFMDDEDDEEEASADDIFMFMDDDDEDEEDESAVVDTDAEEDDIADDFDLDIDWD